MIRFCHLLLLLLILLTAESRPRVIRLADDETEKLQIICIGNPQDYCKNRPIGFKFNDGCRECQCKQDDAYCKTPDCVHFVKLNTPPEKYCLDILQSNEKRNAHEHSVSRANGLVFEESGLQRPLRLEHNGPESQTGNSASTVLSASNEEPAVQEASSAGADVLLQNQVPEAPSQAHKLPVPLVGPQIPGSHGYNPRQGTAPPGTNEPESHREILRTRAPLAQVDEHREATADALTNDAIEPPATALLSADAHGDHVQEVNSVIGTPTNSAIMGHPEGAEFTGSGNASEKDGLERRNREQLHDEVTGAPVVKSIKHAPEDHITKILFDQLLQNREQPTTKEGNSAKEKNAQRLNKILKLLGSFFSSKAPRQNESSLVALDTNSKTERDHQRFGHPHFSDVVHNPKHKHIFSGGPPDVTSPFIGEERSLHNSFGLQGQDPLFFKRREEMDSTLMEPFGPFDFPEDRPRHPMEPPVAYYGYQTGYLEPIDEQPYWKHGYFYGGPYYDPSYNVYTPGKPEPFRDFPESPESLYGGNMHNLHHVKGKVRSPGSVKKKIEKSVSMVTSTNEHSQLSPSLVIPKMSPDTFVMAARILRGPEQQEIIESRGKQISATSGQYAGPVNNNFPGPSLHQGPALPIELTQKLEDLKRELSALRHKHQKCESYRSRFRDALQSHMFGGNNTASSHGPLLNTAVTFVVTTYILRPFE